MALEVVVLDKDEYKALIDNQADEDELEYLKFCTSVTIRLSGLILMN